MECVSKSHILSPPHVRANPSLGGGTVCGVTGAATFVVPGGGTGGDPVSPEGSAYAPAQLHGSIGGVGHAFHQEDEEEDAQHQGSAYPRAPSFNARPVFQANPIESGSNLDPRGFM